MGQSINPTGYRLAVDKNWKSVWHDDRNYAELLHEDIRIRSYLQKRLKLAALDRVVIRRSINRVDIDIYVGKPGMVIGRGGSRVESVKEDLAELTNGKMNLNVFEVKKPDLSAKVVAHEIARKIERRMHFKRVILQAVQKATEGGAKGIKVFISGRLGGNSIARTEKFVVGSVPTSTLDAKIDYAQEVAFTNKGTVGVKVWIYKPGLEEEGQE